MLQRVRVITGTVEEFRRKTWENLSEIKLKVPLNSKDFIEPGIQEGDWVCKLENEIKPGHSLGPISSLRKWTSLLRFCLNVYLFTKRTILSTYARISFSSICCSITLTFPIIRDSLWTICFNYLYDRLWTSFEAAQYLSYLQLNLLSLTKWLTNNRCSVNICWTNK